ncbi:hypothetical protein [Caulobacter sp.]|uniref:hypothetical protein n=1 Tax=Caulobacter sp. TaxID=78 RepID=UPI0031D8E668
MNQIIGGDREWSATYTFEEDSVCVSSAYGSERAPAKDDSQAETVALGVFERIIKRSSPVTKRATFKSGRAFTPRRD